MSTLDSNSVSRSDCQPWRDEKTLRYYYHTQDLTSRECGRVLGCSKNAVLRWMEKHGIDRDAGPYREGPWRDKDTLREEYVEKGRSIGELADTWDTSTAIVHNWLTRHDLPIRDYSPPEGENHWNWKGGDDPFIEPRDCPQCGASHTPDDYRVQYCSRECAAKSLQNRVTKQCNWCGESFEVVEAREDTAKYCSYDCLGKSQTGPRSPRWNGGEAPYGPGWNDKKKEAVRERDGYECVMCGVGVEDHREQFGETLHVHHIVKARKFDDPEKRNAMDNLITLCSPCHREYEGVPLDVTT